MNFTVKYSQDSYLDFIDEFLPDFIRDIRDIHYNTDNFVSSKSFGTSFLLDLNLLEIEVRGSLDKRVAITNDAFKILKSIGSYRALVVFFSKDTEKWRLSLMTAIPTIEGGKVITKLSNPRRYSYLLGSGAKLATPYKYLVKAGRITDFDDLQKRFSVEVVNNEFYREIAKLYDSLVGTTEAKPLLKYPGSREASYQFAVRLIGRIVFCWFLREKFSPNGIPLISKSILSLEAAKQHNYYHSILAPLFFEVLNKYKDKRVGRFANDDFGMIPYLNGGLFSPQNNDYYKFDSVLEISVPGLIIVPDIWISKLFELLETYNFTVDENTSVDIELSIDPEMLGRIFENLLARINPETGETVRKATGSYYTPREIVEYMVDESLVHYLIGETSVDEPKLRALVSYDIDDDKDHPLVENEKLQVVKSLNKVKILDPACGSGAFPIGILQKIVFILQQIDAEAKLWFNSQISNTPPEIRHLIEREFRHKNFNYIRKLGVIRESIFGLDIQPIATEIARLRCFLTLIVDERVDDSENNRGVEPLPNLDFKFVTANTLVKPPSEGDSTLQLFDTFEYQLEQAIDEFFSAEGVNKLELINKLRDLIDKKVEENINYVLNNFGIIKDNRFIDAYNKKNLKVNALLLEEAEIWKSYKNIFNHQPVKFFETKYFFPSVKNGFDIIIGNPPYIQLQKNGGELADMYKNEGYETFTRTGDIYSLFYERGLKITKDATGLLCYITSNKWMMAGYGEKTRSFFIKYNPLILINFGGFKVFESASVDTNILLIQNISNQHMLQAANFKNDFRKDQNVKDYFDTRKILLSNLGNTAWVIVDSVEQTLNEKIEKIGIPLKEWQTNINYGIKTGCNEAFIIDEITKTKLITDDSRNKKIIKSLLRGRDIKRYGYDFQGIYLLATGYDLDIQSKYPSIYRYLKDIGDKITKKEINVRGKGLFDRDDQGKTWWNLRSCDYYEEFEREKIVWPETMRVHRTGDPDFPRFALKPKGLYLDKTTFMMDFPRPRFFLGLINSRIGWKLINNYVDKLDKGGFMMQKAMIERLPIPNPADLKQTTVSEIEDLVSQLLDTKLKNVQADTKDLESRIDHLVYELYDLTPEEIKIIEK